MVFDIEYFWRLFPKVLKGLDVTFSMTILSFMMALIIATMIALICKYKIKILYQISLLYISFFRGSPIITQMFFIYFGLPYLIPSLKSISAYMAATITIALNMSAYMAETIRAAITSVDKGQIEAGLSVGMTNLQIMKRIVFPQAIRIAIPPLGNNFIMTLKGTAVAFTIGVTEIMAKAKIEASNSYRYFECYAVVMIIYWIMVVILSYFQRKIEDKVNRAY